MTEQSEAINEPQHDTYMYLCGMQPCGLLRSKRGPRNPSIKANYIFTLAPERLEKAVRMDNPSQNFNLFRREFILETSRCREYATKLRVVIITVPKNSNRLSTTFEQDHVQRACVKHQVSGRCVNIEQPPNVSFCEYDEESGQIDSSGIIPQLQVLQHNCWEWNVQCGYIKPSIDGADENTTNTMLVNEDPETKRMCYYHHEYIIGPSDDDFCNVGQKKAFLHGFTNCQYMLNVSYMIQANNLQFNIEPSINISVVARKNTKKRNEYIMNEPPMFPESDHHLLPTVGRPTREAQRSKLLKRKAETAARDTDESVCKRIHTAAVSGTSSTAVDASGANGSNMASLLQAIDTIHDPFENVPELTGNQHFHVLSANKQNLIYVAQSNESQSSISIIGCFKQGLNDHFFDWMSEPSELMQQHLYQLIDEAMQNHIIGIESVYFKNIQHFSSKSALTEHVSNFFMQIAQRSSSHS